MDKLKTIKEALEYMPECIDLLESILKSGDCNNCAKQTTCKYVPEWGEPVRYNCPHYEMEEKPKPEHIEHVHPMNRVKTKIACPECGKPLYRRTDIILTCNPPADKYECDACGWSGNAMRYV